LDRFVPAASALALRRPEAWPCHNKQVSCWVRHSLAFLPVRDRGLAERDDRDQREEQSHFCPHLPYQWRDVPTTSDLLALSNSSWIVAGQNAALAAARPCHNFAEKKHVRVRYLS